MIKLLDYNSLLYLALIKTNEEQAPDEGEGDSSGNEDQQKKECDSKSKYKYTPPTDNPDLPNTPFGNRGLALGLHIYKKIKQELTCLSKKTKPSITGALNLKKPHTMLTSSPAKKVINSTLDPKQTAIHFVVDLSGSMEDATPINFNGALKYISYNIYTTIIASSIAAAFKSIGGTATITYYRTRFNQKHKLYTIDTPTLNTYSAINRSLAQGFLPASGGNADLDSLAYITYKNKPSNKKKNLTLVLSDGYITDCTDYITNQLSEKPTKTIIQKKEIPTISVKEFRRPKNSTALNNQIKTLTTKIGNQANTKILGIGITQDGYKNATNIYKTTINATNSSDLPKLLGRALTRLLVNK